MKDIHEKITFLFVEKHFEEKILRKNNNCAKLDEVNCRYVIKVKNIKYKCTLQLNEDATRYSLRVDM